MTTDGGGWTLVQQNVPVTNAGLQLCQAGAVGTLDIGGDATMPGPAKWSNSDINSVWTNARELLIKYDENRNSPGTATWSRVCKVDFVSSFDWHTNNNASNMSQLEDPNHTCYTGSFSVQTTTYTHPQMCGFGFHDGSGNFYTIQAFNQGYTGACGTCGGQNAGRSWLGTGNCGCNMTKYFVR